MGTMFTDDYGIFDDHVLDLTYKLAPKTKKVAKLAKKVRGNNPTNQWRGIVLLYEAFKSYNWTPDPALVAEETDLALRSIDDAFFQDKIETLRRIRAMRDEMLSPRRSIFDDLDIKTNVNHPAAPVEDINSLIDSFAGVAEGAPLSPEVIAACQAIFNSLKPVDQESPPDLMKAWDTLVNSAMGQEEQE